MGIALITGSAGLIGSQAAEYFGAQGYDIVGIDNDMRKYFFGDEASTQWNKERLSNEIDGYQHYDVDIRSYPDVEKVFNKYGQDIDVIIHTAAQPSHDWAAREPLTDFGINANGTLNLLECTRQHCPNAVFIFTSTNKVYGDIPNSLPLTELEKRWEIDDSHQFYQGIDETMSIDQSKHSLFGASKVAADILVQEYGRYFDIKSACFRGGCLTGPKHSGAELHGFLSYLMKCAIESKPYTIFGYKGKQVRDNIHSADLVSAFYHFVQNPKIAAVYNIGGGRANSCSILEAIDMCEDISGKKMKYELSENNREGDHIWYITNNKKFIDDYPQWNVNIDLRLTLEQIFAAQKSI